MTTVHIEPTGSWKPSTDRDAYHVYKPRSSPKPRASTSSPRYVRTWSQEEETYLLEARRARVPYKDIAAHLNKTDLACRLHYHQMVVAKKNAGAEDVTQSPQPEPYSSPLQHHVRAESLPPISTHMSYQAMLLPTPITRDPSRSGSGAAAIAPQRRAQSQSRQCSPSPPIGGIQKRSSEKSSPSLDINRIQELYRDFAPMFWSNIAAAYSHDRQLSPAEIENAFWAGQNSSRPNSPNSARSTSPSSSWPSAESTTSTMTSQSGFDEPLFSALEPQSADSQKSRCSVNALLNKS